METGGGSTLQPLLCLAWLAASLPIVAAALPIPAAAGGRLLHGLLSAFSARGKTVRPSSSAAASSSTTTPSSKAKFTVPQKYFLHFYVVGVAVTTSLLIAILFYAYMKMTPLLPEPSSYSTIASHLVGSNSFSFGSFLSRTMEHKYRVWRTVFVLLLMEIQVLRRLYETEHVFHYGPSARMHIVAYLTGIFYYMAAPLSLASSSLPEAIDYLRDQIAEFIVKGRARMPDLVIDSSSLIKPLLKLGWCQWIGAVIFIWGSLHQIRCHAILGSLRENKDSDEYVIPCGDWFSRVSCPHYLAELLPVANCSVAGSRKVRAADLPEMRPQPRGRGLREFSVPSWAFRFQENIWRMAAAGFQLPSMCSGIVWDRCSLGGQAADGQTNLSFWEQLSDSSKCFLGRSRSMALVYTQGHLITS